MWTFVDTEDDLEQLNSLMNHDAEAVEFYSTPAEQSYFPLDVSRSGYHRNNVHVLIDLHSQDNPYVELVLIACEVLSQSFTDQPLFEGKIDSLKRVEVSNQNGDIRMKCARLIYRLVSDPDAEPGNYLARQLLEK